LKSLAKAVIAAALIAAVILCYRLVNSSLRRQAGSSRDARPEPVRVAAAVVGTLKEEVQMTAEVKALAEVALAPKVTGRLMELKVDEGSAVRKGDLVAVLDKDSFEAAVEEAQAVVEVARAGINNAEVLRDNALKEYNRMKALYEQGTTPQASLDDAEAGYKASVARVDVAKAQQSQAEAALSLAKIQLGEASLHAPFDAVVSRKFLDVGAFVPTGTPIMTLVSIDTVKVIAGVSEKYLADISVGATPAVITVDALVGRSFTGTVFNVSPTLERSTRTADVEIRIPNPDHLLRPGTYARVTLSLREKPGVVIVPSDAILGREGGTYVYLVDRGTVRRVPVEIGLKGAAAVEVVSGLKGGATVVVSGEGMLLDGSTVEIHGAAPSTDSALPGGQSPAKDAPAAPAEVSR
jgi:RND family efflux transporter MFP subunit